MGAQLHLVPQEGSDLKRPAADQHEVDQLKGHFLASLNHEIRTPLSGMLGMTDLLLETSLDAEQKEYVQAARECASQLLNTLNGILEYSAIVAGNHRFHTEEFHLPQLLEAAAMTVQPYASAKNIQIQCRLAPSLPETAIGDAGQIRVILTHLLQNAVKFTHSGWVELRAGFVQDAQASGASRRGTLQIQVQDTGVGIVPEKIKLIFDSFRQLDTGLSRSYSGLGLGLAIVDKLLQLLGGEISVQSQPGQGSLFTVRIPLEIPGGATLPRQAPRPAAYSSSYRILVVEDNRIAQQVISHMLRRAGYEITCASNGLEGVQAATSARYDLVLMDLQMPEMDGLAATKAIRQLPGYKDCPVVALTANPSDEYRGVCEEIGMQGFLSKPIHKSEVLELIGQFLPAA
jgi:CheY-like chemotaxis protein/nitrogen-specific signal transduction histidine kinase